MKEQNNKNKRDAQKMEIPARGRGFQMRDIDSRNSKGEGNTRREKEITEGKKVSVRGGKYPKMVRNK